MILSKEGNLKIVICVLGKIGEHVILSENKEHFCTYLSKDHSSGFKKKIYGKNMINMVCGKDI